MEPLGQGDARYGSPVVRRVQVGPVVVRFHDLDEALAASSRGYVLEPVLTMPH